jgi:ribose 1,5-bisphosphate isomerase
MIEKIEKTIKDIKEIKIQGATNVAKATFEGIKEYLEEYNEQSKPFGSFISELEQVGYSLANARPNEPLARNGLKYIMTMFKIRNPGLNDVSAAKKIMIDLSEEFLRKIEGSKESIVESGVKEFGDLSGVMTHCHSSTVEHLIEGIVEKKNPGEWFSVVLTETRPRYQGRITAKNLTDSGIESLMIVDSAVTGFLAGNWKGSDVSGDWGDWDIPVDAVFIGADQIMFNGDTINKIGSYSVALACYYTNTPIYVVGPLLKMDPTTVYRNPKVEVRDPKEIWKEAPEKLKMLNPAFEIIPHQLLTGFITEFGVLKPDEIDEKFGDNYQWIW